MIQYFIKKTVVTWCLNLAILLLGVFSFPEIASEFIPAIEIPAVAVVFPTTVQKPEVVVSTLIEPLEKRVLASGLVDRVESTLEQGRSLTLMYFSWKLRPEECLQRARQMIEGFNRPFGVLEPIFVLHRPTLSPIYRVVIHSKGESNPATLTQVAQRAKSEMERLPGVSEVRLLGASPEVGVVEVDDLKAAAHGVTISHILESAKKLWGFRHLFKSEPSTGSEGVNTQIKMSLSGIKTLGEMPVVTPSREVPLRWVARVDRETVKPTVFFKKGDPAVILELIKAPGADALTLIDSASQKLKNAADAGGVELTKIYDEAEKIREAQSGVLSNFASGIFLNSIILIFFLGSISGCVIASSIFPTAIFGTLVVLKAMGISFNIFSLNGFSLAAGMITDSSTVVLEAILRRRQNGEEIEGACWKGVQDVGMGVFTGALASSAVLLPVCLQTGVSSKLFSDLAMVIIAANFICLFAVFSLVPWMSFRLVGGKPKPPLPPVRVAFGLSSLLVKKLSMFSEKVFRRSNDRPRFRWGLLASVLVISFGSLLFMPPSELLPMVKAQTYSLTIPIKRVELAARGEELQRVFSRTIGEQKGVEWSITERGPDTLSATVKTQDPKVVDEIVAVASKSLSLPKGRILVYPLGPTPPTEPMNYHGYFYLSRKIGSEKQKELERKFCSSNGVVDCTTSEQYDEPQIILTSQVLSQWRAGTNPVETALESALKFNSVDLNSVGGLPFGEPITLKISQKSERALAIQEPVVTPKGQVRALSSLMDTHFSTNENAIFRANLNEYHPLYFRIDQITIGQAVQQMKKWAGELSIPDDWVLGMGGIQNMNETFAKMTLALGIAGVVNFIILLLQFGSLVQALIVMLSIPLAVGGSVIGLLILRETLNAGVIVGFVLLVGIVVNNGIMLMESLNQCLEEGKPLDDAILEAIQSRTRPILMTACGTIFGMLPTLIFESEGQELYRGMAIVNIFGMSFGSFLTLVVTPILIRTFSPKPKISEGAQTS